MVAARRLLSWRGLAIPAIVAGVLIVAACGGQTDNTAYNERDNGLAADSAAPPGAAEAPGGSDQSLPQAQVQDRKIVRNATLDLQVENVAAAVQQIEDAVGAAGGFVSSSNVFVSNTDEAVDSAERIQTASVTIRVPADAYSSVMSQLRGIAKETVSETSDASEVTEEYTDLQARLRNLGATEARYLELLARAVTIETTVTIRNAALVPVVLRDRRRCRRSVLTWLRWSARRVR